MRSTNTHGGKYDYSKAVYVKNSEKVVIICPIHGEFLQTPANHMKREGCPKCRYNTIREKHTKTTEWFTEKAKEIHGDKYIYDNAVYVSKKTKVSIICPIHGEFLQTPDSHLRGSGCPYCGDKRTAQARRIGTEGFIKSASTVHGGFYTYDKVEYTTSADNVIITCPIHGDFTQTPSNHLAGKGCTKCAYKTIVEKLSSTTEEFIEKATAVHGDLYDYSKVNYVAWNKKVEIICHKHGSFWQTPNGHLGGHKCPKCKTSVGENIIEEFLINNGVAYIHQYKKHSCKSKKILSFDFAVFHDKAHTELKAIIEFDGLQHSHPVAYFGGDKGFQYVQEHDRIKDEYCLTNNIKLIRIPYYKKDSVSEILTKELQLEN